VPNRYQAIAQQLARSIQAGVLRPGERLPSLRALCVREGVSLMTALAAYRRLETLRMVEASPRSGYRVCARELPGFSRAAIARPRLAAHSGERDALVCEVLRAVEDPRLIPLGLGCPSPTLYPLAALRRISGSLLAARPELWAAYSPAPGNAELRRLIAQRLCARGLEVGPHEVLLTTGASEALSIGLRALVQPGELVLVETPTYFGVLDAVRSAGARVVELPGDPELGIDPARLDELCKRRRVRAAVLIPSFANPTGSLMPAERRRECAKVLGARGVALVEDEVYAELGFERRHLPPMAASLRAGSACVLAGSLSKTLLPGARVGFLIARSPCFERALAIKQSTTLSNATLAEHLGRECLETGLFDRHLRKLVPRLELNLQRMQDGVIRSFPAGTRVSRPRGGFLLWVELPPGGDGLALFHAARQAGISIAPGNIFTLAGGLDRFVRLNGAAAGDVDGAIATLGRLATRAIRR
jgi:DNA-binding transcriptional MocR family regulator